MNAQALTRALGGKWQGNRGMAPCPAHDDKNPSLAISDGDDGKVLFHCHAGCSQESVLTALKENGFWLRSLRSSYYHREDPALILHLEELISGLQPETIRDAAKLYLNLENYATFVLHPADAEPAAAAAAQ